MDPIYSMLMEVSVKLLVVVNMVLLAAAALVYMERKVSAFIQNRIGPNRVGPMGLLQPFADVIKLFMKEDLVPKAADGFFHRLAPVISLGIAISVYAVIPFGDYILYNGSKIYMGIATSPDINIGLLFILAMTGVGVYGITLAGWSSNSKYSLLGGLRSSAQMISYEISMGMSLVGIIMLSGSFGLTEIVNAQAGWKWNILLQPLGFIIFLTSAFAETNRAPFDLPEAEPELVGGFNTEYSGMKFGMFFLAEYANMATSSALISLLFLGGWNIPFVSWDMLGLEAGSIALGLVQFAVLMAKISFMVFFIIWVRWSIPRFRYDQLMNLGWKVLLPLSIVNIILTGIGIYIFK